MSLARIVVPKRLATEANVVTQALLVTAIEDERKWFEEEKRDTEPDRSNDKWKWDPVDLRSAGTLILSYSRVRAIENLAIMNSLVKLRLDNNEIEAISGLEALVNLKELDLSFNRITAIQGLSTLTQLTDISLFSNKIASIEHLDAQTDSLESFSIGRNLLHETRSIVYLRKFQKLRILCMEGNFKGTDVSEYRGSTLALLPQLRYLDWTLITDSERKTAQETHHRVVTELPEVTGQLDHAHAALTGSEATLGSTSMANGVDANIAANAAAVREAGLQYAAYVWRIMMDPKSVADVAGLGVSATAAAVAARHPEGKEAESAQKHMVDADNETVLRVPGVPERLEMCREAVAALVEAIVNRGLATHSDLTREVAAADYVLNSYVDASDIQAKSLLDGYARLRKRLLRSAELSNPDDAGAAGAQKGARFADDMPTNTSGQVGFNPDSMLSPTSARGGGRAQEDDGMSENSEIAAAEATLRALEILQQENLVLHAKLIGIETVLHEQRVSVMTEFDAAFAEVASKRNELFQKFFRAVEKEALMTAEDCKNTTMAAIDSFQEQAAVMAAMNSASSTAAAPAATAAGAGSETVASNSKTSEDGEEGAMYGSNEPASKQIEEDVASLLADREGAIVAVSNSFDQRIGRLLAAEDKTRLNERERERFYVKSRLATESERHRLRMGEVNAVRQRNGADIEAMILVEQHTLAELHGDA